MLKKLDTKNKRVNRMSVYSLTNCKAFSERFLECFFKSIIRIDDVTWSLLGLYIVVKKFDYL